MKFAKTLLTLVILVTLSIGEIAGRPASPRPFIFTQPDGTQITLRMVGDEHFHYTMEALTGMPVEKVGDAYYYAGFNASGKLVATDEIARPGQRPAADLTAMKLTPTASRPQIQAAIAESRATTETTRFGLCSKLNNVPLNFVLEGDVPVLVIMVQFSDVTFKATKADIDSLLNASTYSETQPFYYASAREYFRDQSYDKFRPHFDIYGIYTSSGKAGSVSSATSLAVEALRALQKSENIDLSKYDVNNDGAIDNVYMIYAGTGGHVESGYIWPANATTNAKIGGYTVNRVAYCNEFDYPEDFETYGYTQGIGSFCHEFGHVLGLADLYTTGGNGPSSTEDSWTPTYWDIMDNGCDLYLAHYPANMSTFERHALGWIEPYEITDEGYIYLSSVANCSRGAMLHKKTGPTGTLDNNKVFYFEYRDQNGWDYFHSGNGLLIWEVQFDITTWNNDGPNNDPSAPKVKIHCADGKSGNNCTNDYYGTLYNRSDELLAGDPFPGSTGKTEFTSTSDPKFDNKYYKISNNKVLPEITEIGTKELDGKTYMTFRVGNTKTDMTDDAANRTILGDYLQTVTAGIESITTDSGKTLLVNTEGLKVTVSGALSETVEVIDLTGRVVLTANVGTDGTAAFTLPASGLYVLRSGGEAAKILCR